MLLFFTPLAHTLPPFPQVDEKGYDAMINIRNTNRDDDLVDATGMDEAIKLLQSLQLAGGDSTPDKHPEKRLRAAWAQFEEQELPGLMEEKPGLKRQQARVEKKARGSA